MTQRQEGEAGCHPLRHHKENAYMDTHTAKNYRTDGGSRTVIGGTLEFSEDAKVENFPGAANQPGSTASSVAGIRDDFNSLLNKLKDVGIVAPDEWAVTAGLAPSPTEEQGVANNNAVDSVTYEGGVVTVSADLGALEEFPSSDSSQGMHKWVALEIATGVTPITKVRYNGSPLGEQDIADATATGCAEGSFVLYIRAEEAARTPVAFTLGADGRRDLDITVRVTDLSGGQED